MRKLAQGRVVRPTWPFPIAVAAIGGLMIAVGLVPPDYTGLQRSTFCVIGFLFLAMGAGALRDRVDFTGDVPVVHTRKLFVVPKKIEVPALVAGLRVTVMVPFGVKVLHVGPRYAHLWMYMGRQAQIVERLQFAPIRSSARGERPASTGQIRRPPPASSAANASGA